MKGYAGRFLRVDMTDGALSDMTFDEATLRKYLGGTGIGAKILYDEVPPESEWSDPVNRVSIASGPLGGTSVGGSGTMSLVTKEALTGGSTSVQANGLFGAYMRFSGYDGAVIQGASEDWQYLILRDGKAELRKADKFLGLDTYEMSSALRREHVVRGREASVLSIDSAGEAVSASTGWDFKAEEGHLAGRRTVNLMRAFNIRVSMGADLDSPFKRYGSTPVDGPTTGISIMPHWDAMLENYYKLMGWNTETGMPLKETLMDLGLEYVISDLYSV